jgi:hypothetical protein
MVRALLSGGAGVIISGNTSNSSNANSNSSASNSSSITNSMKTDVNRPGKKSMTPLMYAAQVGRVTLTTKTLHTTKTLLITMIKLTCCIISFIRCLSTV